MHRRDLGVKETIELVPDGRNIDVTNENLPEYFKAYLKYHLLGRVETQLTELLLGIFDVVPEPLLAAFDCGELELLLCGVPVIDVDKIPNTPCVRLAMVIVKK